MKINRLNSPADTAVDFGLIGSEALSVFPFRVIEKELSTLRKTMKLPAAPEPIEDMDDGEWGELLNTIIAALGPTLETDTCEAMGRDTTDREGRALAIQVRRALRAVKYAQTCTDENGVATGILLPTALPRRVAVLLGLGVLPLAWVRRLDLHRF